MHQWNIDHGAKMIEVGCINVPGITQKNETLSDSYIREATVVRKQ